MPPADAPTAAVAAAAPRARAAHPARRRVVLAVLALAAPLLAALLPNFWLFLATSAVISAFTALSVGIVSGRAGMISLCQLAFAAIGAFAVAWLNTRGLLPLPLQILAGGLVAVPLGLLIGLPALRLRGVNLAIVTLGFASAVDVVLGLNAFPGADEGVFVTRPAWLVDDRAYFALCWALFVLVAAAVSWWGSRRAGLAWDAVRHSERATAALGLSVTRTKLAAFAASAFVAGIGGGLLIAQLATVGRANFEPVYSLMAFALGVMLATQYWEGALVAGIAMVLVPELLRRARLPADLTSFLFALGAVEALFRGTGGLAARLRLGRAARRAADLPERVGGELSRPTAAVEVAADAPPALETRGLTVRYGAVTALDGVDLVVPAGRVCALIGPNGAGKSTFVDAVSGFVAADGAVFAGGTDLSGLAADARARLGLRRSFQQDRTMPDLTVEAYVRLLAGRDLPRAEVEDALRFLDGPHPERPLATVDVATRRLVEVAGLLAARPRVVLLDEPAAGLAEAESLALARRLREAPARFGCAVLLIEHDMALVGAACDLVTVLDFGRVVASGETRDVLARPEVARAYLGQEAA